MNGQKDAHIPILAVTPRWPWIGEGSDAEGWEGTFIDNIMHEWTKGCTYTHSSRDTAVAVDWRGVGS